MFLLVVLLTLVFAPAQRPSDVVKWTVSVVGGPVAPGSVVKLGVSATVQPGWKLYAIEQPPEGPVPLTFALNKRSPFTIARQGVTGPKPKVQEDENFGVATRYYENEAAFVVPVAVPASARTGRQAVPLEVTFQACGQDICLRPFTQKLDLQVSIAR